MKRNTTIALFYTGVAAVSVGIISLAMWLRPGLDTPYQAPVIDTGKMLTAGFGDEQRQALKAL